MTNDMHTATENAATIKKARRPLKADEFDALPMAVSIETAARVLGIGRTLAYRLAKDGGFPCRVIRIAGTYRVAKADLAACLGCVQQHAPGDPYGS